MNHSHAGRIHPPRGLLLLLVVATTCLVGCGGGEVELLETFEQRWHDNVNTRRGAGLYDMLDAASQRKLQTDLETMRGLPPDQQQVAVNQLGGVRRDSLMDLTPEAYFALLWEQVTDGERPRMRIEASGPANAYMILTMNDGRSVRIRLIAQGGQWRWELPPQAFASPSEDAAPPP